MRRMLYAALVAACTLAGCGMPAGRPGGGRHHHQLPGVVPALRRPVAELAVAGIHHRTRLGIDPGDAGRAGSRRGRRRRLERRPCRHRASRHLDSQRGGHDRSDRRLRTARHLAVDPDADGTGHVHGHPVHGHPLGAAQGRRPLREQDRGGAGALADDTWRLRRAAAGDHDRVAGDRRSPSRPGKGQRQRRRARRPRVGTGCQRTRRRDRQLERQGDVQRRLPGRLLGGAASSRSAGHRWAP